jgi:hypothetical protein
MTQWPAAIPEWGVFPAGAESGTTWVDEEDHTVATPTAAGPITAGATASLGASFASDTLLGGAGGTTSYSGTATASLIDKDAVILQTASATGGGSGTTGDQRPEHEGGDPDYITLQTAYLSTVTITGTQTVSANGQTISVVAKSDPDVGGGFTAFYDFVKAATPGTEFVRYAKCRVIPLTCAP